MNGKESKNTKADTAFSKCNVIDNSISSILH